MWWIVSAAGAPHTHTHTIYNYNPYLCVPLEFLKSLVWPSRMSKFSKFVRLVKDSTFMVSDSQGVEVVLTKSQSTLEKFQVPQCTNCTRNFRDARIMSEVQRVDWDLLHTSTYDFMDIVSVYVLVKVPT